MLVPGRTWWVGCSVSRCVARRWDETWRTWTVARSTRCLVISRQPSRTSWPTFAGGTLTPMVRNWGKSRRRSLLCTGQCINLFYSNWPIHNLSLRSSLKNILKIKIRPFTLRNERSIFLRFILTLWASFVNGVLRCTLIAFVFKNYLDMSLFVLSITKVHEFIIQPLYVKLFSLAFFCLFRLTSLCPVYCDFIKNPSVV